MKHFFTIKNFNICISKMFWGFILIPGFLAISIGVALGVLSGSAAFEVGYVITKEDVIALKETSKLFKGIFVVSLFISLFALIKAIGDIKSINAK